MQKIGIIDSGIGGLTILDQLIKKNINAKFYYISDEKNVPYGNKSQQFMLNKMKEMSSKLLKEGVEGILIACNTATAETIDKLRDSFSLPFIGVEPYLNYINKTNMRDQKVGLILTLATFKSMRFQSLVKNKDPNGLINIYPIKNLATNIEQLKYKEFKILKDKIDEEIKILKNEKLNLLILGCTHYPIIEKYLEKELKLKTINPTTSIISQLVEKLEISTSDSYDPYFYYNYNNSDDWSRTNIENLKFLELSKLNHF